MSEFHLNMNGIFAPHLEGQNLDAIFKAKQDVQCALLSDPLDKQKVNRERTALRRMLSIKCPWTVKYQLLPLAKIINDNCKEKACLDRLVDCLDTIVEKYGKPLLLPREFRPSDWMWVRFKNQVFVNKVDIINGAREILHILGYTSKTDVGLVYPQNVEPVKERVAPLVGELMMAKHEIFGYVLETHPHPSIVDEILPWYIRKNPSAAMRESPVEDRTLMMRNPTSLSPAPRQETRGPPDFNPSLWKPQHLPNGNCYTWTSHESTPQNHGSETEYRVENPPMLPTVLESVKTMNSKEGDDLRKEIMTARFDEIPAGIPHLPVFLDETSHSLEACVTGREEATASASCSDTSVEKKQQDLAEKCQSYQQKLEDIDHQEREIIRLNRDFYCRPDYKAIRKERRQIEKLLNKARNELDLLDEQIHAPGEQVEIIKPPDFCSPPLEYTPPPETKAVQPRDSEAKSTELMPSGLGLMCPRCNLRLRPGEKECFLCVPSQENTRSCLSATLKNDTLSGATAQAPRQREEHRWACIYCSYLNPWKERLICEVCAKTTPKPVTMGNLSPPPPSVEHSSLTAEPKSIMIKLQEEEEEMLLMKKQAQRKFEEDKRRQTSKPLRTQLTDPTSETTFPYHDLTLSKSPPKRSVSEHVIKANRKTSLTDFGARCHSEGKGLYDIELRAQLEDLEEGGKSLVRALKASENDHFTPCEFDFAYQNCGNADDILPWLQNRWRPMVAELQSRVTKIDPQLKISEEEAKRALLDSKADIVKGTELAIHYKLEKIHEVMKYGPFLMDEVQLMLDETEGNVMETAKRLTNKILLDFTQRISEAIDQPPITDPSFMNDVADGSIDVDRRLRMVLAEGDLQSWGRAEMVLRILKRSLETSNGEEDWSHVTLEDMVESVKCLGDYRTVLSHLQQECQVCYIKVSKNKLRNLVCCECNVCIDCLRQHFEIRVRERHVRDWVCPVCSEPDIEDEERRDQHFQFMDLLLKNVVKTEVFDLFEEKLRDWSLMNDPNFRWCSHCDFGQFQGDDATLKMACSKCHKHTCFGCRKQWEDQHENLTCEEFREWKEANHPEHQQQALAKVLAENGIDCPACKFRYALAKGGCMHFKCTQCRHEFCSGCLGPYKRGKNCTKHESCKRAGLHCHHPRDCLFYMRDYRVDLLQKLLKDHRIEYNTNAPEEDEGDNSEEHGARGTCPVMEQKELPDGLKDEPCGLEVLENHAGLCGLHYKEYLVGLINKNHIDPIEIMEEQQLVGLLEKNNIPIPPKRNRATAAAVRGKLIQLIQDNIPLPKPAARTPLLPAAQARVHEKQPAFKAPKKLPEGIRRIPVENAEEAVQWI